VKNVPEANGRVGIWGTSYPGWLTLAALRDPHPALVAAVPFNPVVDVCASFSDPEGFLKTTAEEAPVRWRFGDFVLDSETRQLRRAGREVHLQPRSFDLLELLLRERPRALAGTRIRARLWPDAYVTDASLHVAVSDLRTALGEDAKAPQHIRTVHRFGYAFEGDVTEEDAPPVSNRGTRSAARVIWEQKTLPWRKARTSWDATRTSRCASTPRACRDTTPASSSTGATPFSRTCGARTAPS
jgi:DNA-binding winged helix-turn-helix (wHTH) protein